MPASSFKPLGPEQVQLAGPETIAGRLSAAETELIEAEAGLDGR